MGRKKRRSNPLCRWTSAIRAGVFVFSMILPLIGLWGSVVLAAAPTAESMRVKLVYPANIFTYSPVVVLQGRKLLEQEGIIPEWTRTGSGSLAVQVVVGGKVLAGAISADAMLDANARGADLFAVGGLTKNMNDLVVHKDIYEEMKKRGATVDSPLEARLQALKQILKGKVIVYTRPGSGTHRNAMWLLKQKIGLDPEREVNMVSVGGTPTMLAALSRGSAQGFTLSPPEPDIAVHRGFGVIVVSAAEIREWSEKQNSVLAFKRGELERNQELARKLTRAFAKANNFTLDHPGEAARIMWEMWFPETDQAVIQKAFTNQVKGNRWNRDGLMNQKLWDGTQEAGLEAGQIPARADTSEGRLWSNRFLR